MLSIAQSHAETQLRRARADLEAGLRAGKNLRAEAILNDFPAVAANPEAAIELVYTEFVLRQELGEQPTPAEWYERFPQLKSDLEQMFQVHDVLCQSDPTGRSRRPNSQATGTAGLAHPRLPSLIPGYEVDREIGRGGMGVVYKAKQLALNRTVALK